MSEIARYLVQTHSLAHLLYTSEGNDVRDLTGSNESLPESQLVFIELDV